MKLFSFIQFIHIYIYFIMKILPLYVTPKNVKRVQKTTI